MRTISRIKRCSVSLFRRIVQLFEKLVLERFWLFSKSEDAFLLLTERVCISSLFSRKKTFFLRLKKMFNFCTVDWSRRAILLTKFTFFTVHSLKKISPTTWIPCRKIKSSTSAGCGRRATTTPTFAAITLSRMTWTRLNWALTWTQTTTPTTAYSAMNSIWIISLHPEAILWLNLTVLLTDSIWSVWGNGCNLDPHWNLNTARW